MRKYIVNNKLEDTDIFLLMEGNAILEGGILPVCGELYEGCINQFARYNERTNDVRFKEDAECIRKRINEACTPLYGFTAYLASKIDFYSCEFDEATFSIDEQGMYKMYTSMLPVGIPVQLRNSESGKVKQMWRTFYQQTFKDEQKSQENTSYKTFFGDSLEEYRKGYLDWLRWRIIIPLPPSKDYDVDEWSVCIVDVDDIPVFFDSIRGKETNYIANVVKDWIRQGKIHKGSEKGKLHHLLYKYGFLSCTEGNWNKKV